MDKIFKCKVRDISAGRWEIRLEQRNLPEQIKRLAGNPIVLKFSGNQFQAYTGIASKGKDGQYFWINTHKNEAGLLKDMLEPRGYKANDEILLLIDTKQFTACVTSPIEAKLRNVIDMGLNFSAMVRLFEKQSKEKLWEKMLADVQEVFKATSEEHFRQIHSNFCKWGVQNVKIAKGARPASYGQIAKTFDVVLKVAIYYSRLPDPEKSEEISKWLHAAVDRKMMAMLKKYCSSSTRPWPTTLAQVDSSIYARVQDTVREFIRDKHSGNITPVQFDDIYWEALNRRR